MIELIKVWKGVLLADRQREREGEREREREIYWVYYTQLEGHRMTNKNYRIYSS